MPQLHPPRHPLFPLISEVHDNPTLAHSDHLPILVEVALPENDSLKIISLNTLGPNSPFSGLHNAQGWETEDQTKARYTVTVTGLAAAIEKHDVEVLLLQETAPELIIPVLEKSLGDEWEIIQDETIGIMTCFKKNRLKLELSFPNEPARIRSLTLQHADNGLLIDVHNIWGFYDPFPHQLEAQIKQLLTETTSHISVIAGDTNSRIAPLDSRIRNITTGIVPVKLNQQNGADADVQISDYPDGAFCRQINGAIVQLETHILNYDTGEIINDDRTLAEAQPWPEYRMVLCLDDEFKDKKIINEKTIWEYQSALCTELQDANILVRMAANSFNQKAVAVRFSPNLKNAYEYIQNALANEPGFQFRKIDGTSLEDCGQPFPCIFAPIDKEALLHQAMSNYINTQIDSLRNDIISQINQQISRLTEFKLTRLFLLNSPEKKSALRDLVEKIKDAPLGSTAADLSNIITAWEGTLCFKEIHSSDEIATVTNRDVLATHRNLFFQAKRTNIPTSSENMLDHIKSALSQ